MGDGNQALVIRKLYQNLQYLHKPRFDSKAYSGAVIRRTIKLSNNSPNFAMNAISN